PPGDSLAIRVPSPVLLRALLAGHLICAFGAIVAFWVAAFAPKGGRSHRRAGRRFASCLYAAALTGAVLAIAGLIAPALVAPSSPAWAPRQRMALALYLLIGMVTPVQHGLAVVAAGPTPLAVRSPLHAILANVSLAAGMLMLPLAVAWQQWG